MKRKKVLILSCHGGNGLLQAAKAREDEILQEDPDAVIIKRDTMSQWMGSWFGAFAKYVWNRTQRNGNIYFQIFFLKTQMIAEYFATPQLFLCMFYVLMKEDVDEVIDSQIFGTAYFIKAIRLFNRIRKKNVVLEKVMIDLPTIEAEHFFCPIRRCTKKDRPFLKFVTIKPLLKKNETEEIFWKKTCKLSLSNILYRPYIVRKAFTEYENRKKCQEPMDLEISFSSSKEKEIMQKCFSKGSISFSEEKDKFLFHIGPKETLITILLGSQPSYLGTFGYVKKIIDYAKKSSNKIQLFIFCAAFDPKKKNLFLDLCNYINSVSEFPNNLSVVPFSYQSQERIAPLLYRSNKTITRAGGGTAMELLAVMRGQIFIHSEMYKDNPSRKQMLRGLVGHECGAAIYLEEKAQAKIVNPELFYSHL